MKFESWSAFWAMGGYGFYVWLSFAVTLLVLLGQVVVTVKTKKRLLREVSQKQARAARREAARKLENTL
ncbi:heme exporter protein CcmD [Oceanimonas baumannii]|uniref:Heme exporter protein D n=1 Tax=Oceanimonas baumannii TaxID=129578 RepID=A0A235CMY8_9GAMM|nr:heme exporter protein CcmD [Oceanimonas baumannii]MCC4263151.1 heme exporter protein CcmD [Oceanimonas baumannii]OYD25938.1 heme exporter protein CcmD [Oceanimonas baumannii]TDW60044.1 heme exporter protein D [Oceanimonas baumannii]